MTFLLHAVARLAPVLVLVALGGRAAFAQVSMTVVAPDGRPVPSAQVEWYALGELLGSAATDPTGAVQIPAERWKDVVRIHVRFLGMETRVLQVRDIPTDGVIRLEPRAVALPGITVEVGSFCPMEDEPGARAEWSRVADRYASDTGQRARSAYFRLSKDRTDRGGLTPAPAPEAEGTYLAQSGGGVIHGGDRVFRSLDDRAREDGYAWPPFFDGVTVRQLHWVYPALDRDDAHHFASAAFGALHDFQVLDREGDRVTLGFCGRGEHERAVLRGTLTLRAGREFASAEWRVDTATTPEGAGGWVEFSDYVEESDGSRHLVAAQGSFFRRSTEGADRYVIERTVDAVWHLFPTADHPCTGGRSVFEVPPRSERSAAFSACMERTWAGSRRPPP